MMSRIVDYSATIIFLASAANLKIAQFRLKKDMRKCSRSNLCGWGRFPEVTARICRCEGREDVAACLQSGGTWIPFGLGRSYGDSALGSQVLATPGMGRVLDFNREKGTLTCQAGLSLARLIALIVPDGWFLPVTPGTRQVTVGGAIASDVHGKNHHSDGCFSNYVNKLFLMLPDGEVVTCSASENSELFRATCGGMGLTGVILTAEIRLRRIESAFIQGRILACRSLEELLAGFEDLSHWPYLVAWCDGCSVDDGRGRFLLMAGWHGSTGGLGYRQKPVLAVPTLCPGFAVNRQTIKMFNTIYFHKSKKFQSRFAASIDQFFYPLDRLANWNRLYGRRGFLQYQLVLPKQSGNPGLRMIFREMARSAFPPALAVLKLLGEENANYLSFPLEGYTLALDYKITPGLFSFLKRMDRIVTEYGGRLYLAKDARMPAGMLRAGYPGLNEFIRVRDRYHLRDTFQSRQARRLQL